MTIRQISLTDFRNLSSTTLAFHPQYNLIVGDNGSGKTSLLESIHILCQGQSFKTKHLTQAVHNGKSNFLLFGQFDHHKIGISRDQQNHKIRIDGHNTKKLSDLAKLNPVRIIDANCINLISGKPSHKREFIDWCLFHVEHDYPNLWIKHSHALKQKNALLKNKTDLQQLEYWDQFLSEYNLSIFKYRSIYINQIKKILDDPEDN